MAATGECKGLKKNNNKKSNKFRAAIFVLEL
jgi:hypothetical protein